MALLTALEANAQSVCVGQGVAANPGNGIGDALSFGPFTCDRTLVFGNAAAGFPNVGDARTSPTGAPVSSAATFGPGSALASSELGANHVNISASAISPNNGWGTYADSVWGDVAMIVGPSGAGSVFATFTGHLDGFATVDQPRALPDALIYYSLEIGDGTGSYGGLLTTQINNVDSWSFLGNGSAVSPGTTTRSSNLISDTFAMTVRLPVNTPLGISGLLSAQSHNGGFANFLNTGALDEIILPAGYGFSAHGTLLAFDGTGYSYPVIGAVPEPESWALMFAGLAGIGLVARRRVNVKYRDLPRPIPPMIPGRTAL